MGLDFRGLLRRLAMKRIAHRGLNTLALQNTVPAFELAVQHGMDGIELDVQLASCDTPMVFHDDDLLELFGVEGTVRDYSIEELQSFVTPKADEFPDVDPDTMRIPRLTEVLDVLPKGPDFLVNVELKAPEVRLMSVTASTAQVLADYKETNFIVSSFNPLELLRFHRHLPEIRTALLFGTDTPHGLNRGWPAAILRRFRLDAIHPEYPLISREMVERAHRRGLEVNTWTINDPDWWAWLESIGVDAIISDDPR